MTATHFSINENEAAVAAATAGLGITSTSERACRRELAEESLVRLLVGWKTADIPVHAYSLFTRIRWLVDC
jgi:DNA-binding transcriptional LysR family regulator